MKLTNLNFKFNDNLTSILLIYLDTVALGYYGTLITSSHNASKSEPSRILP